MNAFSRTLENHQAAIAIQFAYYSFCRIHQSLRVTPAMEAGSPITCDVGGIAEGLKALLRAGRRSLLALQVSELPNPNGTFWKTGVDLQLAAHGADEV